MTWKTDRVTAKRAFWQWFALGSVIGVVLLYAQSVAVGGVGGLLQVGETSNLRPLIEDHLGSIPLAPGRGHDGQIYYAIALDLAGNEVPDLLDHGAYRYRRIFYPLISALGGFLDGWPLLWSMMAVVVGALALTSGLVAAIAVRTGESDWLALAVLLNPGVWLSVRLLTADILALALMVVALALVTARPGLAIGSFSLSALSKDVYLATPAGLAVSKDRNRWLQLLIPAGVLVLWMIWLTASMGEGFTGRGNLAVPLTGILDAAAGWSSLGLEEQLYVAFALLSVAAGLVYAAVRRTWLRWSILAWSSLALISSSWVWDVGNNAARAFAPIAVLVALAYVGDATTDVGVSAENGSSAAR